MFIKFGHRRINLGSIREYSDSSKRGNYTIKIMYNSSESEELNFFQDIIERNKFIEDLDRCLLIKNGCHEE